MTTFKIYPFRKKMGWNKACWWTVRLLETPARLRKETAKKCPACKFPFRGTPDTLGLTHRHGFRQRVDDWGNIVGAKPKGELGLIFIQREDAGGGVVSHEMTHAMLYTVQTYANVVNFHDPLWERADETMAQIVGNLVNGFYKEFYGDGATVENRGA